MNTTKPFFIKRCLMMITGILFIGICVGSFRLSEFGVDAFTCMNLGISGFLHLQFGTWQLIMNAMILIVIFFTSRHCIGPGTIVNMAGVGYLADFICWLFQDCIRLEMTLPLRILALFLGMLFAGVGVALYMTADLGIAPYDAVGIIIEEMTRERLKYDKARVISDAAVVIAGVIFCLLSGGNLWLIVGIGTICNACFNGPLIQFFKSHVTDAMLHQ